MYMDKTNSKELERVSEGQQRDKYETSSNEILVFVSLSNMGVQKLGKDLKVLPTCF